MQARNKLVIGLLLVSAFVVILKASEVAFFVRKPADALVERSVPEQ